MVIFHSHVNVYRRPSSPFFDASTFIPYDLGDSSHPSHPSRICESAHVAMTNEIAEVFEELADLLSCNRSIGASRGAIGSPGTEPKPNPTPEGGKNINED
jgi:hypothetical protein